MLNPASTLLRAASIVWLLLLSACFYEPPSVLSAQTTATLVGSRIIEPSGDEIRVAAYQVDGRNRLAAIFHWETPFAITAGQHKIVVYIFRFSGGLATSYGMRSLTVTLEAGHEYRICTTDPVPYVGRDDVASSWANNAQIWIEDSNGVPIDSRTNIFFRPPTTVIILPIK